VSRLLGAHDLLDTSVEVAVQALGWALIGGILFLLTGGVNLDVLSVGRNTEATRSQ
jgi:hypothetical protein